MKACPKCKAEKPKNEFHKDSSRKDGLCAQCIECRREARSKSRAKNLHEQRLKEKEWRENNREKRIQSTRKWRENNREHVLAYGAKYREENREKRNAQKEEWRKKNISRVREYARQIYATDLNHKMAHKMRGMVNRVVSGSSVRHLEYSPDDLMKRIEFQFSENMTWDNYGEWEIDHKIPVSRFIEKGERRPYIVNALSNLQPMWRSENRSKGNRYIG